MNKRVSLPIIIILTLLLCSFLTCENPTKNKLTQAVYIYAERGAFYRIMNDSTYVYGRVIADEVPEFHNFKINDITSSQHSYDLSILRIGSKNETIVDANISSLDIEVETSIGKLSGTITKPDSIIITLSEYDTLQINKKFTIGWEGGNADFYEINLHYIYRTHLNDAIYVYKKDFVKENSITYPQNTFPIHGKISYLYVLPINGPFPEKGSLGNMEGVGSGYLYYIDKRYDHSDEIVVGNGFDIDWSKDQNKLNKNDDFQQIIEENFSR